MRNLLCPSGRGLSGPWLAGANTNMCLFMWVDPHGPSRLECQWRPSLLVSHKPGIAHSTFLSFVMDYQIHEVTAPSGQAFAQKNRLLVGLMAAKPKDRVPARTWCSLKASFHFWWLSDQGLLRMNLINPVMLLLSCRIPKSCHRLGFLTLSRIPLYAPKFW